MNQASASIISRWKNMLYEKRLIELDLFSLGKDITEPSHCLLLPEGMVAKRQSHGSLRNRENI